MKSLAWYDLQVIICSAIMMSYYFIVLRNKKFHQYNRFYILAVFFLSFLIPLIKIQLDKMETQQAVVQFIYVLADYNAVMDKAVAAKGFQVNWNMMAIAGYALISAFFLFTFIIALFRIRQLLRKYSCNNLGDVYLILTNVKGTPFSFFRYIFWNEEIDLHSATGQQILQHELTHVKEKHSIDNIMVQVMMVFGWVNPFFWIAKKELQMIHEFIADKKSVDNGDAASLAEMLLTATYPQQQFLLTNSFFFSPIKRRLLMITNNKNPRFSYMRRLIVLPLMAIVVLLFAFRMKQENKQADHSNTGSSAKTINAATILANTVAIRKDTTNPTLPKASVFVVNGERITYEELNKIDQNTILSMNVLKGKEAIDKYGKEGENGAIEIKLKPIYVLEGKIMASDFDLDKINKANIESINVLSGIGASYDYGDEGKRRGVVVIKMKASSYPLYIIDGKKMPKGFEFSKINSPDIESINVLKDEVAVNKYGDEAKNGVLEIKMKTNAGSTIYGYTEFLDRNKEVKACNWNKDRSNITIVLNDGTNETYDLTNGLSRQRAIDKYGALPIAPATLPEKPSVTIVSRKHIPTDQEDEDYNKTFTEVQIPAEFPGGKEGWQKFLIHDLNRDLPVKNGAPPGKYTVKLNFIVHADGKVTDINTENDPGYGTKEEAIRVMKVGPDWNPAIQNGHTVTSIVKQTITFVITE